MFKEKSINTIIDAINTDKLSFNRYKYVDNIPVTDGIIDIDSNILEEHAYVETFLSDYKLVFELIDDRNEYEVVNYDDSSSTVLEKNTNYNNRMESIKSIKKTFIGYVINNFKRNKNDINNILVILDLYTRMRYYNLQNYPILSSGYTIVGERYKIITSSDENRRVGTIYTETNARTISTTNSVQSQFGLIYERDVSKYIVKSIISEIEFNSVLRNILVPVGWDFNYIQIASSLGTLNSDVTIESDNIVRLGNLYYFDNITQYINDVSNNNFNNNRNVGIEKEFIIG